MPKEYINTPNAPTAIGTYSQAVKVGETIYLSGQIPVDPAAGEVVAGDFATRVEQVFKNLQAVCEAAGGTLQDIVKLNVYLTDLGNFPILNEVMGRYITEPYPARAAVEVSSLPKGVDIEMDAIAHLRFGDT